jgi:hypothetical protein
VKKQERREDLWKEDTKQDRSRKKEEEWEGSVHCLPINPLSRSVALPLSHAYLACEFFAPAVTV